MKRFILLLILPLICNISFGQKKEEAEVFVREGVVLHDKGDYAGAIGKYNKALELDADNLLALAEKGMSLLSSNKAEESVKCCEKAIEKHPGDSELNTVYITLGNALDALNRSDEANEIYDEGIKLFPEDAQLHFNKGIAFSIAKKYDEAILCFEKSVSIDPTYPSYHNAIARTLYMKNKKIPSILAYGVFLCVEPQSERAVQNLSVMQEQLGSNVKATGKNEISISLDAGTLGDTLANGNPKENSFGMVEMILSFSGALDVLDKNKTDVEKFQSRIETIAASLEEQAKTNSGFYWTFYAPFYIAMKEKGFIETFSYVAFASSKDKKVKKWIKNHPTELKNFFNWSNSYSWDN